MRGGRCCLSSILGSEDSLRRTKEVWCVCVDARLILAHKLRYTVLRHSHSTTARKQYDTLMYCLAQFAIHVQVECINKDELRVATI